MEEQNNQKQSNSFFSKFKAFIQSENKSLFISTYFKALQNNSKIGTDKFQFILTEDGLEIGRDFKTDDVIEDTGQQILRRTKLSCNKGEVDQRGYESIKWVDQQHKHWDNPKSNKFVIKPVLGTDNQFIIEIPFGDRRPKLIPYNPQANFSSAICCSARPGITE